MNWWKGYYRKSIALLGLEKYEEAYEIWKVSYSKEKNNTNLELLNKIEKNIKIEDEDLKILKKNEKEENFLSKYFKNERKNKKGKDEYLSMIKKKKKPKFEILKEEELDNDIFSPITPTNSKFVFFYNVFYIPEIISSIFQFLDVSSQVK
jgi:hypothetical protein